MLFFRSLYLVAALAFATVTSAVPVEGAALAVSGDVFARDVTELALPVKRGASVPELYNTCHSNVQGVIVKIKVAIQAKNHVVIVGYLNEIIGHINVLVGGLRLIGRVELDVTICGGLVYDLISIITEVLYLLVGISIEITACINIIGGLLATLIQVTVSVVIGLEISIFVGILSPLGSILGVLGFINIFVGIGIIL